MLYIEPRLIREALGGSRPLPFVRTPVSTDARLIKSVWYALDDLVGTRPYRYLIMRRLDRARALMRSSFSIADAAYESGFADQSHMTRQFKRTYGLSPGRWRAIQRAGHAAY